MRIWRRAIVAESCGFCGEPIVADDPLLEIQIGTVRKLRCGDCAGEPVPSLPARVSPAPAWRPLGMVRTKTIAESFDYKAAQTGDSE
jgi:hypothetical protein